MSHIVKKWLKNLRLSSLQNVLVCVRDNIMHRDDPVWQKAQQGLHHCTVENERTLEFFDDFADCLLSWFERMKKNWDVIYIHKIQLARVLDLVIVKYICCVFIFLVSKLHAWHVKVYHYSENTNKFLLWHLKKKIINLNFLILE